MKVFYMKATTRYLPDGIDLPVFGSGEAKGIMKESVRGDDIVLLDVCNYSLTYSLCGLDQPYVSGRPLSGSEACHRCSSVATADRVNVIMPFLYESRQHKTYETRVWTAHWLCRN